MELRFDTQEELRSMKTIVRKEMVSQKLSESGIRVKLEETVAGWKLLIVSTIKFIG
jgi:hypothetical protein